MAKMPMNDEPSVGDSKEVEQSRLIEKVAQTASAIGEYLEQVHDGARVRARRCPWLPVDGAARPLQRRDETEHRAAGERQPDEEPERAAVQRDFLHPRKVGRSGAAEETNGGRCDRVL